jgi:hypothetical protein
LSIGEGSTSSRWSSTTGTDSSPRRMTFSGPSRLKHASRSRSTRTPSR